MSRPAGRFAPRLALAVGALLAAALGVVGVAFSDGLRRELTADLTRSLTVQARLGAESLGAVKPAAAAARVRALSDACACRVTLVSPDGSLAADSGLDAAALAKAENHATRPEIAAALRGETGSAVRHSATLGVDLLYAAAPSGSGALRLALPLGEVQRRASRARALSLWTALVVLAAALAAAWALARSAGRPLEEMAETARRLAAGDYGARVRGPLGGDEREVLGETLNALAERVEATVGELERDRGRLAAVLDQMAEGVVAVDAEGRVLLVNPALSRLLAIDPAQARGRGHLESLRHRGLAELLAEVLRERGPRGRELRLFAPDELVFDAHAAPLPQPGGAPGALVVLHDITRLRRLEQMRRDFVANVSHELRTPLASIKGFAETLLDGALEDKKNREGFVREIEEQSERLSTLVEDLLDLSAIESGHRAPRLQPLELGAALGETAARFAAEAGRKKVALRASPAGELPRALADGQQLRQVLGNLVENALKYTEPGGSVELSARAEGAELVVSVKDTGIGIPEADLPRVFERFYRVDKARSREAGGTGLGLAIVKHLVEAQGGRVWVESRQPGGSAFSFSLPAAQ